MHCNKLCFNILFFWKRKISSIIFVQMTLCQSAILVTQRIINIFFRKLPSINILKTKKSTSTYYTLFKNKTTEFGSNCYICPAASYDKVICIFFPGCSVSFLEWHTAIFSRNLELKPTCFTLATLRISDKRFGKTAH